ncbi:MAG: type IV pilus twitching motility protein PilT [Desulfovibrionales bacterium]
MLRAQLDHIIGQIMDQAPEASDIIFTVNKPVQVEVHGVLQDVKLTPDPGPLLPFHVESIAMTLMGRTMRLYEDQIERGSCDLSYELPGRFRFRVNIFSQRGSMAIVLRKLAIRIPDMDELGLPEIFTEIAKENYGLVLVTGATGTGKTTSLAALIDMINSQFAKHIITLEDPVEYVHPHKKATINQRELGIDFDTFSSGLRAALRQAPKVILVGEIRDQTTTEIALEAAETGHLVLGTLHTSDAGQSVNRIIGMFELSEERLIRARLAESLKYVVSQRLLPKIGGGRVAAFEVLRTSLRIRELILNGESDEKTFYHVLETSTTHKMVTFDQHLRELFLQGLITEQAAMAYCSERSRLSQMLDKIKAERGEKVTDIDRLELDYNYGKDAF